jgi:polyisoprenoid-binding protein YceI
LFLVAAVAHATLSNLTDPHVTFEASGPAGLKFEGSTSDVSWVEAANGTVTVTVDLTRLATGIALRDRHMRERYLEVPKYPTAVLSFARSGLQIPSGPDKVDATVPATLTLHGQSHPVVVRYDAKREGGSLAAHGSFRMNMNDFGVQVPTYLGVTVKPDIDVRATFHVSGD